MTKTTNTPNTQALVKRLSKRTSKLFRYKQDGNPLLPAGAAHFYMKLDESWGIKFQQSNNIAPLEKQRQRLESCYLRQQYAADLGLAPLVGDILEVPVAGYTYFGFVTQHAYTLDSWDYWYGEENDEFNTYPQDIQDYLTLWANHYDIVVSRLKKEMRIELTDKKSQNMGVVNRELVVIDWGREGFSFYEEDDDFYKDNPMYKDCF